MVTDVKTNLFCPYCGADILLNTNGILWKVQVTLQIQNHIAEHGIPKEERRGWSKVMLKWLMQRTKITRDKQKDLIKR